MKKLVYLIGLLCFLCSCEKKDNTNDIVDSHSDYLPLAVGNYWVYQGFYVEDDGISQSMSEFDSSVISKDTVLNGKVYFQFDFYMGNLINNQYRYKHIESTYLRDSSKYLIDIDGKKYFSEEINGDTLYCKYYIENKDTFCVTNYTMEEIDSVINTSAGSYTNVLYVKGTLISNPNLVNINYPRYIGSYYAKNTGKILTKLTSIAYDQKLEKRLVRYNIIQ